MLMMSSLPTLSQFKEAIKVLSHEKIRPIKKNNKYYYVAWLYDQDIDDMVEYAVEVRRHRTMSEPYYPRDKPLEGGPCMDIIDEWVVSHE